MEGGGVGLERREKGQQWFGCHVEGSKCQGFAPVCWNLVPVHEIECDALFP